MLLTLLACATPVDSAAGGDDSADTADTADTALAPLSGEVAIEVNPDNPLAAIVTVTMSRAVSVHLEYGLAALDRVSPSAEVEAGTATRLQALGLTPDSAWSVQVVADGDEDWRSEVLAVQTEAFDPAWSCTPSFVAPESEYSTDEVVCSALNIGDEFRYLCWDRWGTPRLSFHSDSNDQLLSLTALADRGWAGTSQNRSTLMFLDPFGVVVGEYGAAWFEGKTRYPHAFIDAHDLLALDSGPYEGSVAVLTGLSEAAADGQYVNGNGLLVFDPVAEVVRYDYSLLGAPDDGVSADERLPFTRPGTIGVEDWAHANGIAAGTDADGRQFLVMSLAAQNWLVKLYPDTDALDWRLGYEGDFTLVEALGAAEPVPRPDTDWFFHQHGPAVVPRSDGRLGLLLFDNGEDRGEIVTGTPGEKYSRVLELELDEAEGEAALAFEHGPDSRGDPAWFYSANRGSVQILPGDDRLLFLVGDSREVREVGYPDGESRWRLECPSEAEPMQRVTWLESLYAAGWLETTAPADTEPSVKAWVGRATVDDGYVGTEAVVVRADGGLGGELCRVEYPVVSTAVRSDCAECLWAFNVVFGAQTVVMSEGCEAAGVDLTESAEGETRAYGLALDYLGHAHALMIDQGGTWSPVAFAEWEDATSSFGYRWEQGTVE